MANFDELKEWVTSSWKAQSAFREAANDDYNFLAGHQWTDTEKAALEEQSRVPIVFNRTAVIISSVAGSEINNRTEVRFIPREIGDIKPNEVLTAGAEWFRDQSNAEDEESTAFTDLLVCGLGVTDTSMDYDAAPKGKPQVDRIDLQEFGWDHYSHKKGLTDARYFFQVSTTPRSEAEDRFEGKDVLEIDASWIDKTSSDDDSADNIPGDEYTDGELMDEQKDTVTVVRIQHRERQKFVEYIDPANGQRAEMDKSKWDAIIKKIPLNVPSRTYAKWVWKQAFLGRSSIIDENQPDPVKSTFNVMTGQWDRKDKLFFGLLRSMKDPQKYANKWLSQTLHIINSNAKGGVMVEPGAAVDQQQFEESWAAADGVTWLNDGAITGGKIQEKPKVQMPSALMSLTEFAISSIRDVSGVNMELLGLRDANQPGILEYQRRQSAMTTLAPYFDALRFYRKNQGESILHFLINYVAPSGQLVRLVKEDQAQYVPLATEDDTREYDVIVDDAPQAPNEKEKSWGVIQAMMPMLQNANLGMEDWADILEYSPLPASFADKVRAKATQQKQQGPSPEQQMAMQLELKKVESEIAENMANAQYDAARTQQVMQETEIAPMESMAQLMGSR